MPVPVVKAGSRPLTAVASYSSFHVRINSSSQPLSRLKTPSANCCSRHECYYSTSNGFSPSTLLVKQRFSTNSTQPAAKKSSSTDNNDNSEINQKAADHHHHHHHQCNHSTAGDHHHHHHYSRHSHNDTSENVGDNVHTSTSTTSSSTRHPSNSNNAGWSTVDSKDVVDASEQTREVVDPNSQHYKQKSIQVAKNALISRRRIPPNFLQEVFIPHLERFIWEAKQCPPWYLLEVVIAYSQMPIINKSLSNILADTVILRLIDYNGPEFTKMLLPFYRMRPDDLTLFAHFSIELEEHFFELATLHLIGIARIYAKIQKNEQQIEFLENMVIPRLQTDIAKYDTEELSALLVSLAAAPKMDTLADVALLAAVIPQIERRYDETPLLTTLVNLNALCRLRVYHKRLLDLATRDLEDRWRIRNIPPKYIAVAVWTFGRYNLLHRILPAFEELIADNLHKFTAREFARFCQVLPKTSPVPLNLTLKLLEDLPNMSRDHFLFYMIGIIRRGFLPTDNGEEPTTTTEDIDEDEGDLTGKKEGGKGRTKFYHLHTDEDPPRAKSKVSQTGEESQTDEQKLTKESASGGGDGWNVDEDKEMEEDHDGDDDPVEGDDEAKIWADSRNDSHNDDTVKVPRESILHECLEYCDTFENDFEVDEIHRLGYVLRYHPQYSYISTMLPKSWETIINEVMFMGK